MTNRKPLLMLSLPNSGSTWLADLIAKHTIWNRYQMEYFNPLRNHEHYGRLSLHFGCELVACYQNIAVADYERFDDDVRDTFGKANLNFTKEVFSPFKLKAFQRHFQCFVLVRSEADTFPPKRARVWSFYEHAWWGMIEELGVRIPAYTAQTRAIAAYRYMRDRMLEDARILRVPVIRYRDLFEDKHLPEILTAAIGEVPPALLKAIASTRVLASR